MTSFNFKKLLPHLLIVLGFAIVAIIFCMPAYKDMVLSQGDITSWKGMSHEAKEWHEKTGENTLWSNSMFGGMPTYTFYVPESHNYIGYIQLLIENLLKKPAQFFFLAMLSFYILMCTLRVNRWLGIVGAIAFAFSSYNAGIIVAGHDTKMYAIAYMPAVIAGLLLTYRGKYLGGGTLLALAVALMFGTMHYQIVFYTAIVIFFMIIGFFVAALKEKKLQQFFIASAVALAAAILAIGPSTAFVWTTVGELNKETMRGGQSELSGHDAGKKSGGLDKEYAFRWSEGIGETFCLMIPYLYGGSDMEPASKAPATAEATGAEQLPLYWGDQPFLGGPTYVGAIICFLFLLGMMVIRNPVKWWLLGASALAIMLSWGRHFPAFNYWFFDHIPFYNAFRTPTMTLVIVQLTFPMLGIWGLWKIMQDDTDKAKYWNSIKWAAGITAGLCVLLGVGGSMFFDFTNTTTDARYPQILKMLKEDRTSLAMKSGLTSAVYILIAAGLLWAFVKDKLKNKNIVIAGIGILVAIDLIGVSAHYLNEDNYKDASDYEQAFVPRPVDEQIMKDPDPYYRVLDVSRDVYNDAQQAYFHKCIGGYSPAKLEIYQDLIDRQMSGKFNAQVLNMLNTKYVIFNAGGQQQSQAVFQPLPTACGNAWFVNNVKWAKTADEEMNSLNAPALGDTTVMADAFDPRNTAVIRETFHNELNGYDFGKDSSAAVMLAKYGLNTISFTSHNSKNGLAVFSDIYYSHGWHAYVDGKETPIIRANYVLRAIKVPAGNHKIVFDFHPDSYYTGDKIALFSSIILWGLIITALVVTLKNYGKDEAGEKA